MLYPHLSRSCLGSKIISLCLKSKTDRFSLFPLVFPCSR